MTNINYPSFNLHTHTTRCGHAVGAEREYIEAAIAAGIKTLGFSDHIPIPPGYRFEGIMRVRMPCEQTGGYVSTLQALREEYRNDIRILIGYEGEYFEKCFDDQMRLVDSFGCDYLILGQHFLVTAEGFHYTGTETGREDLLTQYVDKCIQALKTGRYAYIAHPDLFCFVGDEDFYASEMTRLCRFCLEADIPLEINLHGVDEDRWYPCGRFFRIAGETGNRVLIGVDAHRPGEIGDPKNMAAAAGLIEDCGLQLIRDIQEIL